MDNYVRKLKIRSLFTDSNNLTVEFDENVNCIYGSNGTGKTTVINIIVASLNLDLRQLSKLPFKSVLIQTSQTGKKRAKPFLEVSKTEEGTILIALLNSDPPVKKEFNYKATRAESDLAEVNVQDRQDVIDIIKQHLTITYVPLSRMQENEAYDSNRPEEYWLSQVLRSRHLSSNEIAEIIDPNKRMLKGIEGLFKQRYTEAQKKINEGLDNLKDTIISKLLLDKQYVTRISSKRQEISSKELPKSKFEEYSNRLRSASLNVEVDALTEHFKIIDETVNEISEARKNYFIAVDTNATKDVAKYREQYWEAERKYRALYPIHD